MTFRHGAKIRSVGAVSLNRLRVVLGRAGVSPRGYKLVKVSAKAMKQLEAEGGNSVYGWVSRDGAGRLMLDARGRPIINLTPREAGGSVQVSFLAAGNRLLKNSSPSDCPGCGGGRLRYYFHEFNRPRSQGTLWLWCPDCGSTCHLPRVTPSVSMPPDPLAALGLEEFARLETESDEPFQDRLDRLWREGKLQR